MKSRYVVVVFMKNKIQKSSDDDYVINEVEKFFERVFSHSTSLSSTKSCNSSKILKNSCDLSLLT